MDSRLTRGLTGKDLENFKHEFRNSLTRRKLVEVIESIYISCDKEAKALENYDKAAGAWPYKRASYDGELRALTKVLNLIKINGDDHDRPSKTK